MVDRPVADEVDRADDVVEVVCLEQCRRTVLRTGDEVALDPELQPGAARELAIGLEVVLCLLDPEGVPPQSECLLEAVDVLGHAELGDPGRRCGLAVTLHILSCEVPLRGSVRLVGAKVKVVVGEHERA